MKWAETISREQFIERLRAGKDLPTGPYDSKVIVKDSVDLRGKRIGKTRVIRGVEFRGAVDLRELCVMGTLDLTMCIFAEGLRLDDAEIEGSLKLDYITTKFLTMVGIVVRGQLDLKTAKIGDSIKFYDFVLEHGSIEGSLDMRGILAESLKMRGLHIKGDLLLGCGKEGTRQLSRVRGAIEASNIEVGGSVKAEGIGTRNSRMGERGSPNLILSNARIHGSVEILPYPDIESPVRKVTKRWVWPILDSLDLSGAQVGGNVVVLGGTINEDFRLEDTRVDGNVMLENFEEHRTEIGGTLYLSGIRSLDVRFLGVSVSKGIMLISGELGRLIFGPGKLTMPTANSNPRPVIAPCHAGRLIVKNTSIRGSLDLSYIQIPGSVTDYGRQGLILEDCRVAGDLMLWKIGVFRDLGLDIRQIHPWDFSAAVIGDLRIRRCRIDGSCVLTFVKVSGEIDLQDSSVGGDLQVDSTWTYDSLDRDKGLRDELRKEDPRLPRYRTTCSRLLMRMLCCENDIDLTGLKVVANYQEVCNPNKEDRRGCVEAQYLDVKGDLLAYYGEKKDGEKKGAGNVYVEIPGSLDLSYANIKHLTASAHSFPAPDCPDPEEAKSKVEGLILDHAQIGTLDIRKRQEQEIHRSSNRHYPYPKPISLTEATIGVWKIEVDAVGERVRGYKDFLANDSFSRSTYSAVEKYLRDEGHGDDADKIYRVMRNREWREYIKRVRDGVKKAWEKILPSFRSWFEKCFEYLKDFWKRLKAVWEKLSDLLREVRDWWNELAFGKIINFLVKTVKFLAKIALKAVPHYLYKISLQFGTSPGGLLLFIIILAAVSFPVYKNPLNFEASPSFLAEQPTAFSGCMEISGSRLENESSEQCRQTPKRGQPPSDSEWGVEAALAMMFHYHIPVAPLMTRTDWEARGEGCLIYGGTTRSNDCIDGVDQDAFKARNDVPKKPPFFELEKPSPEDFVNIMQLLNLIFWPLLLTFWLRRLLRQ